LISKEIKPFLKKNSERVKFKVGDIVEWNEKWCNKGKEHRGQVMNATSMRKHYFLIKDEDGSEWIVIESHLRRSKVKVKFD
jgi:hypothetical protein